MTKHMKKIEKMEFFDLYDISDSYNEGGFIGYLSKSYLNFDVLTENSIIMKYTGLEDKNGKEIYEGDILKAHMMSSNKYETGIVEYQVQASKYVIEYGGGYAKELQETGTGTREVIGNKFENPELLENT